MEIEAPPAPHGLEEVEVDVEEDFELDVDGVDMTPTQTTSTLVSDTLAISQEESSSSIPFAQPEVRKENMVLIKEESLISSEIKEKSNTTASQILEKPKTEGSQISKIVFNPKKSSKSTNKSFSEKILTSSNLHNAEKQAESSRMIKFGTKKVLPKPMVIPGSQRPDGSVRKEIKVRPGYVPPEEAEEKEVMEEFDTPTNLVAQSSEISQTTRENQENHPLSESLEKVNHPKLEVHLNQMEFSEIKSEDKETTRFSGTSPSSQTLSEENHSAPITQPLTEDMNIDALSKPDTQPSDLHKILEKEETVINQDKEKMETEIQTAFAESTKSILNFIDHCRKVEGELLLNMIAQRYGLQITIHQNDKNEVNNEKKRKLSSQLDERQVRTKIDHHDS